MVPSRTLYCEPSLLFVARYYLLQVSFIWTSYASRNGVVSQTTVRRTAPKKEGHFAMFHQQILSFCSE